MRAVRAVLVLCLAAAALVAATYARLPSAEQLQALMRHPQVEIRFDDEGAVLSAECRECGIYLRPDDIPARVEKAVVAIEDRRFHWHWGVDPIGIARAVFQNASSGGIAEGGSTITQQLAKLLMLSGERTLVRKFSEAVLAVKLEANFTKEEILAAYLNHAYFGESVYSIEQAARFYFGKRTRALNLYEAALLAGMLKAPNRYNLKRRPESAHERTETVLAALLETRKIGRKEHEQALRQGVRRGTEPYRELKARYFVSWLVKQDLPLSERKRRNQTLYVVTTLDPNIQLYGRVTAKRLVHKARPYGADQVALVAMAPRGAVRAMIGGVSFRESQFNRATQARRQPASAFKPLVYLAALEAGMVPESRLLDRRVTINGWSPRNFDGRYLGKISLADGLVLSRNAATVRLAQDLGTERIVDLARRLGMTADFQDVESLALGTIETSLLEMTKVYAAFANGGRKVAPFGILGVRDAKGAMLHWRPAPRDEAVVEARHVRKLNWMLRQAVTRGTGKNAAFSHPACGKTGTSQDHRDAWFIGYSGQLVTGLWVGNDAAKETRGLRGGGMTAKAWRNFMENAHIGRPPAPIAGLAVPVAQLAVR